MYRIGPLLPAILSIAVLASAGAAYGQRVGTTGAVRPSSTGTPPGGGSRTLELGADVVFQERIQTTASGSLQVLFVDRTSLSVGPNSDITIDEFVYNPSSGSGTFVASVAKGSFRFVGGQISKTSGATIRTPVATMGIRGTVVGFSFNGRSLQVSNFQGNVTVSVEGGGSSQVPVGSTLTVSVETGTTTVAPITVSDVTGDTSDPSSSDSGTGNAPTTTESFTATDQTDISDVVEDSREDTAPPEPTEPPDNFEQEPPPDTPTPPTDPADPDTPTEPLPPPPPPVFAPEPTIND